MKDRHPSETRFTAYNLQALKLPETPQASAVIAETTPLTPIPPATTPTVSL